MDLIDWNSKEVGNPDKEGMDREAKTTTKLVLEKSIIALGWAVCSI